MKSKVAAIAAHLTDKQTALPLWQVQRSSSRDKCCSWVHGCCALIWFVSACLRVRWRMPSNLLLFALLSLFPSFASISLSIIPFLLSFRRKTSSQSNLVCLCVMIVTAFYPRFLSQIWFHYIACCYFFLYIFLLDCQLCVIIRSLGSLTVGT